MKPVLISTVQEALDLVGKAVAHLCSTVASTVGTRTSQLALDAVNDIQTMGIGGVVRTTGKTPAKAEKRGTRPVQLCPVPGCKGVAAPIFGMVCGDHRHVAKSKIAKYRKARKVAAGKVGGVVRTRKPRPTQYCPVPKCKGVAAPIFGMVCSDHKNVAKSKIVKYRKARKEAASSPVKKVASKPAKKKAAAKAASSKPAKKAVAKAVASKPATKKMVAKAVASKPTTKKVVAKAVASKPATKKVVALKSTKRVAVAKTIQEAVTLKSAPKDTPQWVERVLEDLLPTAT